MGQVKNYIGGTDDSLTLLEYLVDKQKAEIPLSEIFEDTGLKKLNGDFCTSPDLGYTDAEGETYDFYYAIDLIVDLAALMLECSVTGSVSLGELLDDENGETVRITFTEEEKNIEIKDSYINLISGKMIERLNLMKPYDVYVLKKNKH